MLLKTKCTPNLGKSMAESQRYAEWKKPDIKTYVPSDSNFRTFWKRKNEAKMIEIWGGCFWRVWGWSQRCTVNLGVVEMFYSFSEVIVMWGDPWSWFSPGVAFSFKTGMSRLSLAVCVHICQNWQQFCLCIQACAYLKRVYLILYKHTSIKKMNV
jgi:hypothetical protein